MLITAYEMAKEQKQNFGDDITGVLRLAKKKKWLVAEEKRVHQEIELQTELNTLLLADKDRLASFDTTFHSAPETSHQPYSDAHAVTEVT